MFDFLSMANNYEDRKVDRFEGEDFIVDTCEVTDSDQPFETGIKHTRYDDGNWIIVEMYEDIKSALVGHEKWVSILTADTLPAEITDVSTAKIKKLFPEYSEHIMCFGLDGKLKKEVIK